MSYIPDRGDIIWLDFDPQAGHEHNKRRPALVLSPKKYNQKTSLCIVCPMTSKIKNYPFEVVIEENSAVLSDQVKSLDWRARHAKKKGKASQATIDEVMGKLSVLIGFM